MVQLRQLGGRLLGKKRVAVILGLLGLCSSSSLWAEKLDTTFVLDIDMTIDMTPCYYTKYNGSGQIVDYGIYWQGVLENNLFDNYDQSCVNVYYRLLGGGYSRINIGIVTNEEGLPLDTLFYACDRVTKQWREVPSLLKDPQYSYEFYDNGMLSGLYYYGKYRGYQYFDSDEWVTEQVPSWMAYITYSKNGYPSKFLHETYSAGGLYHVKIGVDSHEELNFDTWGNYSIWNSTTYDERHNLIQTVYENNVCTHAYDSLDRRIKTVNYDAGYNVTDSVIYTYGHPLYWGKPYLLSLRVDGHPIQDFAPDKFQYDLPSSITYNDIYYIVPYGSSVEEFSYDSETEQLTISVYGGGSSRDSSNTNTYTIRFSTPESYITSMTCDGIPVEGFSQDKYEYDFLDSTSTWFWGIDHEFSPGSTVEKSYDDSTNTLSIRVYGADFEQDSSNVHTYSIRCKAPEAYLTSLSFNGSPVDNFSPTTFKYTLGSLYSPQERAISYTASPGSIVTNTANGTSLHITVENEIIHQKNEYNIDFPLLDVCLTSLCINGNSVDGFSWDKYEYDFSDSLEYQEDIVSYTTQQFDVVVNGLRINFGDWGIRTETKYDEVVGIFKIFVYYDYAGKGQQDTADQKTYVIKFIGPKLESFLTSLKLDGMPIDSFSADKYIYDFSDYSFSSIMFNTRHGAEYLKNLSEVDVNDDSYVIRLSKPNDSNDGIESSELSWTGSKYAIADFSYEEETGIFSIAVKGYDYAENSSNIHVYKILTKKIDCLSIDSFQVYYFRGEWSWSNNVNVIANEHEYRAFSPFPTDFTYDWTPHAWSASSNIDVTMDIKYSEEAHTIYYIFSHRTIQSLVDTYSVVLQPCVTSIFAGENLTYEAFDKLEHYINREYKAEEFKYELPTGVVATESYDDSTNILTLTARFGTGDTTSKTEYHIHFRPIDGVDDFLGDQVKLYVTDKTICIDGATAPIYVYNILGTLVGTGQGEEIRIPVPQAGVYVVRSGEKAAKVVVK